MIKKYSKIASILGLILSTQGLEAWHVFYENNTNEPITVYPRYDTRTERTNKPGIENYRDINNIIVIGPNRKLIQDAGIFCLVQVLVWQGDQKEYVRNLAFKKITYGNPEIYPTDVYSSTDLVFDITFDENRCRNWDVTISKDADGYLTGTKTGHIFGGHLSTIDPGLLQR